MRGTLRFDCSSSVLISHGITQVLSYLAHGYLAIDTKVGVLSSGPTIPWSTCAGPFQIPSPPQLLPAASFLHQLSITLTLHFTLSISHPPGLCRNGPFSLYLILRRPHCCFYLWRAEVLSHVCIPNCSCSFFHSTRQGPLLVYLGSPLQFLALDKY